MSGAEVVHAVLQVTQIAKEILRRLGSWPDYAWRCQGGAIDRVKRRLGDDRWGWGMTDQISRNHYKKERNENGKNYKQVRI